MVDSKFESATEKIAKPTKKKPSFIHTTSLLSLLKLESTNSESVPISTNNGFRNGGNSRS